MEEYLYEAFRVWHWSLLVGVTAAALALLGWGADRLVHEAVALSLRTGFSKAVIGATVVSLGTTSPEAAVSVFAAINGHSGLALGNAVGSIICDSGLILGLAAIIAPLKLDAQLGRRQGWVQFTVGLLLVATCWPLAAPAAAFTEGGNLPRAVGFVFLLLLIAYLWQSVRWARTDQVELPDEEFEKLEARKPVVLVGLKLFGSLAVVILASTVLIPAVRVLAERANVPESVISATLVAFGTSLPELVTAVASALKGHGELALGNVVGADILNVLFVAGAAAAVTKGGLDVEPYFFSLQFVAMLLVIGLLRARFSFGRGILGRPFGLLLLAFYAVYLILSFAITGE